MSKVDNSSLDIQLANVLFRITVLEHVLLQKGLISQEEVDEASQILVNKVSKFILERLDSSQSLDDFIASLSNGNKN